MPGRIKNRIPFPGSGRHNGQNKAGHHESGRDDSRGPCQEVGRPSYAYQAPPASAANTEAAAFTALQEDDDHQCHREQKVYD